MKLPCAVVRDLLPLYAEKMTEPETRALMEEHLQECPECRKKYKEMDAPAEVAVNMTAPLHTLKKEIRRRRRQASLIAGLMVFVLIIACFYRADSLEPLPWQDGLVEVTGVKAVASDEEAWQIDHIVKEGASLPDLDKEALVLRTDGRITGIKTESVVEEDGTVTAVIQGFARSPSPGQEVSYQEGNMLICPVPDRLIYGYENPQKLLWGEAADGGMEVLPRLVLGYYVLIAAGLAVVLGILWRVFRKRQWSRILRQMFFVPVSYGMAHLLLMGTRTTSFFLLRDLCYILLTGGALYVLLSLLWQVRLQYVREG